MTRVEEWTRADTGVGAAMAAGSHLEKGIWALLVIPAIIIKRQVMGVRELICMLRIIQWPWIAVSAILTRIITSPMRLESAVIMPAASDLGF